MCEEDRCYICGRTNDEVENYLRSVLSIKYGEQIECKNKNSSKLEENLQEKIDELKSIKNRITELPNHIQNMKVSTIRDELDNLKTDFPILEKALRYSDSENKTINETLEEYIQKYAKERDEKVESSRHISNVQNEKSRLLNRYFSEDFKSKMYKLQVPINSQMNLHKKESLKGLTDIMNRCDIGFEESYHLLKRAAELISPILANRYHYKDDNEIHDTILKNLKEDEQIKVNIDDDLATVLTRNHKNLNGKIEDLRKEFYMPETIKVPICYVCQSIVERILNKVK